MLQVFISGCRYYHKKSQYIVVINVIIWIIIIYLGLSQCYCLSDCKNLCVLQSLGVLLISHWMHAGTGTSLWEFQSYSHVLKAWETWITVLNLAHINDYHNDKIYQKVLNCTFELLLAIGGSVLDLTWILDKLLLSCMCCWN